MNTIRHCGSCGRLIPPGDRFCSSCGKPVAQQPGRPGDPTPKAPWPDEGILFENALGRLTTRRLILAPVHRWTRGSAQQDILLRAIASVDARIERQPGFGVLFLVAAVALLRRGGAEIVYAAACLAIAVVFLRGSWEVRIALRDGDASAFQARPWQARDAEALVEALQAQLVRPTPQQGEDGPTPRWG